MEGLVKGVLGISFRGNDFDESVLVAKGLNALDVAVKVLELVGRGAEDGDPQGSLEGKRAGSRHVLSLCPVCVLCCMCVCVDRQAKGDGTLDKGDKKDFVIRGV